MEGASLIVVLNSIAVLLHGGSSSLLDPVLTSTTAVSNVLDSSTDTSAPPCAAPTDTYCPDLGCFSNSYPWVSLPLRPCPPPVCDFEILFCVLDRVNTDNYTCVSRDNISALLPLIDCSLKTYVICHGFTDNVFYSWPPELGKAISSSGECNVIMVDWHAGCTAPNYPQAVSNTRIVAAWICKVVKLIMDACNMTRNDFHLIGHSLGAHVCAYASNFCNNLFWITGLDPAGPCFEGCDTLVRLDANDACFVDVYHTNVCEFGMATACGTLDFYFNNGCSQPGCNDCLFPNITYSNTSLPTLIVDCIACSHLRAVTYYMEACNNDTCIMWGRKNSTTTSTSASNTSSVSCSTDVGCSMVGLNSASCCGTGEYYLDTNAESPYCMTSGADYCMGPQGTNETQFISCSNIGT